MDVPTDRLLENIDKNIPLKLKKKTIIEQEQKDNGDSQVSCYASNSRFSKVVIKTKTHNHSINKFKNLGYDRRLQ